MRGAAVLVVVAATARAVAAAAPPPRGLGLAALAALAAVTSATKALALEQSRDAERKAELLKILEAEKAQQPPSFVELLRLENCEARMTSLVEITKPRTRGGRHCIHGGRKECPDVGFQKRGAGKEACALLTKLVT